MRQQGASLTAGEIASRAERRLKTLPGLIVLLCACHDLTPKQQHAADVFECRVHALYPYVGDVVDVADAVRETAMGSGNPLTLLTVLGVAQADIRDAVAAWNQCDPEVIVAPIPEAGNKVL